jgi:hypothetical protein
MPFYALPSTAAVATGTPANGAVVESEKLPSFVRKSAAN